MGIRTKGFGWKRDFNDPRDFTVYEPQVKKILTGNNTKKLGVLKASDLPPSVDNRKWCSPIEDQGQLGSCTATAAVGMYEYMENKASSRYIDGSRLFLYKATRLLMGKEGVGDSGAYIRTTLGAIRLFGVPNEEYWPYSDENDKFDRMPDPWLWTLGQRSASITYFRLDHLTDRKKNILLMKGSIEAGFPLIFGFVVFDSYRDAESNGGIFPYPSPRESIVAGHSVLIVGYDDNKVAKNPGDWNERTGCFLVRNSWGKSWGDQGYGWLPYEYFLGKANPGWALAESAWTIVREEWQDTGAFMGGGGYAFGLPPDDPNGLG